MSRSIQVALMVFVLSSAIGSTADAAQLGMGFRVGEVTQNSAIVWTRITKNAERNWNGFREPRKREPKQKRYVPSAVRVEDREGAMPGASGQLRALY